MCLMYNPGNQQVGQALAALNPQKDAASAVNTDGLLVEDNLIEIGKKSRGGFWLDHWLGRTLIIASTVRVAILCACIMISMFSLPGAILMFMHPAVLIYFPLGLGYMINHYFLPELRGNNFFYYWSPYLIYSGIFISAILINKRAVFLYFM